MILNKVPLKFVYMEHIINSSHYIHN